MLKRFFLSMLGTIAGLWITVILLFVAFVSGIAVMVGKDSTTPSVKSNSILHIDLSGVIDERLKDGSIIDYIREGGADAQSLENILNAVRLSASDSKIKGIFIDCGGSSLGVASREELVSALREFRKSGKWIYAYADNYTQGDFYTASVADKMYLNPVGAVDVHGLASSVPFFKPLLDKLGVQMQVIKVGTYKSAVEPYILNAMSEPARMQAQVYVDAIWKVMANAMAAGRGVRTDVVASWADSLLMCTPADRYVDMKVVDALKYRNEFESMLKKLIDQKEDEDLRLVEPADYMAYNADRLGKPSSEHIAVLYAVGDIVDSGDGGIVATEMVPQILDLADDDDVKALVLRVNSGGGSAFASEQIWHALDKFKETGKPFYVSMGDYAASGGYYISCGADKIYCDSTTLTGSIGIFGMIPNIKGLLNDKVGINISTVVSGPNGNFPTISAPMTPAQHERMQAMVEQGYRTFVKRVSDGREMSVDSILAIAEGRVWDGVTALQIGLVDNLGSLRSCLNDIARKVDLDSDRYVAYPAADEKIWARILRESGNMDMYSLPFDKNLIEQARQVEHLLRLAPVQARMEPVKLQL